MLEWLKRFYCNHMYATNFNVWAMSYHKECVKCGRLKR